MAGRSSLRTVRHTWPKLFLADSGQASGLVRDEGGKGCSLYLDGSGLPWFGPARRSPGHGPSWMTAVYYFAGESRAAKAIVITAVGAARNIPASNVERSPRESLLVGSGSIKGIPTKRTPGRICGRRLARVVFPVRDTERVALTGKVGIHRLFSCQFGLLFTH